MCRRFNSVPVHRTGNTVRSGEDATSPIFFQKNRVCHYCIRVILTDAGTVVLKEGDYSMRKFVVAGNWKMNLDIHEGLALVKAVQMALPVEPVSTKVVLCPPFPVLYEAHHSLNTSFIGLGAQNMSDMNDGAFTGEVSGTMLRAVGCGYVILGHSERRQKFGESNDLINMKVKRALECGLQPIVCVGETLDQREQGITETVVGTQIRGVLEGIHSDDMERVILAYEPVWAIGTGRTATPEQAQEVHEFIRTLVVELFSSEIAEKLVIQYGGSMKPENAFELLSQADINGGLIGGASLNAEQFIAIVAAAESVGSNHGQRTL